ncbi:MAG: hypothetical protein R2861_06110 [Desulfobacterales bacterium]
MSFWPDFFKTGLALIRSLMAFSPGPFFNVQLLFEHFGNGFRKLNINEAELV